MFKVRLDVVRRRVCSRGRSGSSERATGRFRPECPWRDDNRARFVNDATARAASVRARDRTHGYRPSARKFKELVTLILVLRCLRKIIVPIICWVASETLNRQCSTSESLSNLEASFGLISRFESIAHRYNYFFFISCVFVFSSVSCVHVCI